jgi:hypothetical protein
MIDATKQQQQPEPVSGETVNSEWLLPRPHVCDYVTSCLHNHPPTQMHVHRQEDYKEEDDNDNDNDNNNKNNSDWQYSVGLHP